MECFSYLRHVQDLKSDGKPPYERRLGQPFKGPIIPFGSLVEYYPISAKDQSRIHQVGKKVLPGLFLGKAMYAGVNLEGWHIGCRHWGVGNDGRIWNLFENTQCKRGGISQRKWNIYFPVADGRIKLLGGDQELRTSTLIRERRIRGENHVDFLGESEGSLPPPQDSLVEADESTRIRSERVPCRYHEDHVAAKGINSLSRYNLVHKFIPMLQALKIPDAKAAVEKEWENWRKYQHGSWQKSETQKVWSRKQGMRVEKFFLRRYLTLVITRIRSRNQNIRHIKVELYSEVTLWKVIRDHTQNLQSKVHLRHKWRPQKSWTLFQDCQDAQDKQRTQNQLTPRSKWKMHHRHWKIPKSECPDITIRLPKHKWPKSWSKHGRFSRERNLYGHPLAGIWWERQFDKVLFEHGREKVPDCECVFVNREQGLFLSV